MHTTTTHQDIQTIAEQAIAAIGDQVVVSQSRCVDVLLDVLLATDDPVMRCTIGERLRDLRFLSMVEAAELRADLEAIVAICTLDPATDLSWAEESLACCCDRCTNALAAVVAWS